MPLTAAGKNVLVVSHQYALEPLALYLAGKARAVQHCGELLLRRFDLTRSQGPEEYAGAMDLPNGKALAVEDLKKFVKHSEHGMAKKARARPGLTHRQPPDATTPARRSRWRVTIRWCTAWTWWRCPRCWPRS